MADESDEGDVSGQDSDTKVKKRKSRDDLLSDEDVCKAIQTLQAADGSTFSQIKNYLMAASDKYRDVSSKLLEAGLKKAVSRGVHAGKIRRSKNGLRFRLACMFKMPTSSKRRRCPKGPCRGKKRGYCSRFRKRCCYRRKRCCRRPCPKPKKRCPRRKPKKKPCCP